MNDLEAQVRQDLWSAIKKHYISNDFTEALRDAAFLLKDVLQNKSGEYDKDNAKLVEATLNGSNPILKVNSFSTQSEKDFQAGIALGIKGIFMHVRNPISHEKIDYSKEDADAILLYINYLLRQVDKSNYVSLIEEWLPLVMNKTFTYTEEYAKELIKEIPKKKVYELLVAMYDRRVELPKYRLKFFIRELTNRLSTDEYNNFINMINADLAQTNGDYSLAMFFHFFAEHFYIPLKRVVKLRIEDLVYQGIENGMYKTNETEGNYSIVATWAAEHIQKFETSAKCIDLIRKKSLCTQDGCSYILMYFKSFVDLHNDENRIAIDKIINEQAFNENIYKFIRHFVFDKTDKLYLHYKEKIDEYENKYVAEQDRIPEEFDLPF